MVRPCRWAFFRFQNCPMVLVASSSHSRSASSAINSTALKNFTALGFGRPNGRSLPALTRMATSSGVQFSSFATCAASNRAGRSFAAQVVIAVCVRSSVINQSISFGHRNSTSHPARAGARESVNGQHGFQPAVLVAPPERKLQTQEFSLATSAVRFQTIELHVLSVYRRVVMVLPFAFQALDQCKQIPLPRIRPVFPH